MSVTEAVKYYQQIGTRTLLIINNCILGLLWGNQCFFLFGSHSKDGIGRVSATSKAVLLKKALNGGVDIWDYVKTYTFNDFVYF